MNVLLWYSVQWLIKFRSKFNYLINNIKIKENIKMWIFGGRELPMISTRWSMVCYPMIKMKREGRWSRYPGAVCLGMGTPSWFILFRLYSIFIYFFLSKIMKVVYNNYTSSNDTCIPLFCNVHSSSTSSFSFVNSLVIQLMIIDDVWKNIVIGW